jgi:hypothetical protein
MKYPGKASAEDLISVMILAARFLIIVYVKNEISRAEYDSVKATGTRVPVAASAIASGLVRTGRRSDG